jgi:hypothetical protein
MSSFTDQKQRIATKADCKYPWYSRRGGEDFRCGLCGYKFKPGDKWRWIYTNHTTAWGNPLICKDCDGTDEEVIKKWKALHNEYQKLKEGRLWWFIRDKGR